MIKMQDKILNIIDTDAKNYELEAVIAYGASNTGNLYIMDSLDNVLIIQFNFQTSYASFKVYGDNNIELDQMSNEYLEYKNSTALKEFLGEIEDYLREYDMEKHFNDKDEVMEG